MSTLTDCHSQSQTHRSEAFSWYPLLSSNSKLILLTCEGTTSEKRATLTQYPGSVFREVKSSKVKTYEPPCKSNSKCVGSIRWPGSAILSTIHNPQSTIYNLHCASAIDNLQSTLCNVRSTTHNPQCAMCERQSTIHVTKCDRQSTIHDV